MVKKFGETFCSDDSDGKSACNEIKANKRRNHNEMSLRAPPREVAFIINFTERNMMFM